MDNESTPVNYDTTVCASRDVVSEMIKYEVGELQESEIFNLFQTLVDTGMAWRLQGHYGRMAEQLIEAGIINQKESTENDSVPRDIKG